MKKSKKKIILLAIIILLCIFMILIGGKSYSKYLTQIDGTGVIDVAKWAFLVNGKTASITNINLAQSYDAKTLTNNRIAPGTRGSFDIVIDTTGSEVGIDYDVVFTNEKSKPQNLQFIYEGHVVNSIKGLEQFLTGTIDANSEEKIKTMTIEWVWPYETGNSASEKTLEDAEDTRDGLSLEKYQFDIIITGRQVEPTI